MAIQHGILGLCRDNPVLDVGCGNPYQGLFRTLRSMDWRGQYVGIDEKIPKEAVNQYREDIILRTAMIDGARLPLPPNLRQPTKEIAAAFCIDTMAWIRNKDALMGELKRVGCMAFVMGGVTELDLRGWGCQKVGYRAGTMEPWGIWMNLWAEGERKRMDGLPSTGQTTGFFASGQGVVKKQLHACANCNEIDYTGLRAFQCRHCSAMNGNAS